MINQDLSPYLIRLSRRLRLRDSWTLSQRTLWLAFLTSNLVLVLGRLWPINNLLYWSLVPVGIWIITIIGYTLLRPFTLIATARQMDIELGLKERISTCLELDPVLNPTFSSQMITTFNVDLVNQLKSDAFETIRQINPTRDIQFTIFFRPLMLAALTSITAGILIWAPNPMDLVLQEREVVAKEAARQAEKIEALHDEIEKASEMTPEERNELLKMLERIAEQLRNNQGNREQALADLTKLEQVLRDKVDPQAGQRQAVLEGIASQLKSLANMESNQQIDPSEVDKAIEQLAELMNTMTPEERQALAQQLARMAVQAAQVGDTQTAESLSSFSQAALSGSVDEIEKAAKQVKKSLAQANQDLANQRAINQSLSQLQESRRSLADTGQQRAQSSQPGQNGQAGQGQNSQGQGQGQSQGQQAGSGGGTKANTLPGSRRSGQADVPQGTSNTGKESQLDSQVYVPREKRPESSDEITISGQDTDQGTTISRETQNPMGGANNPSLIPYQSVYQTYIETASKAIDQTYIPSGLKDYVKAYFSQLEP